MIDLTKYEGQMKEPIISGLFEIIGGVFYENDIHRFLYLILNSILVEGLGRTWEPAHFREVCRGGGL